MILIHGKAGTGKSTLAAILSRELQIPISSIAYPLKKDIWYLEGYILGDYRLFDKEASSPFVPRLFGQELQFQAEAAKDKYGQDYWMEIWRANHNLTKDYIVDDIRFPYELDFFKRLFPDRCITIKMKGDFNVEDGRDPNHPSEQGIDDDMFDYVIPMWPRGTIVFSLINAITTQ